jgi:hypothetical protein
LKRRDEEREGSPFSLRQVVELRHLAAISEQADRQRAGDRIQVASILERAAIAKIARRRIERSAYRAVPMPLRSMARGAAVRLVEGAALLDGERGRLPARTGS